MLRKKSTEERSPQEFEIAVQEAAPEKGLKPFLHKHWKKLVAVVVVLAILLAVLLPKKAKQTASTTTQYTEVSPETRNITNVYSASGTLSAANSYTVKPLVKGEVLTADFEVGDTVEEGDVLYTIDSSDVISGVEKAELNLGQAQRSYDDAVDAQYIRTDIGGLLQGPGGRRCQRWARGRHHPGRHHPAALSGVPGGRRRKLHRRPERRGAAGQHL